MQLKQKYIPDSVPAISNHRLFNLLVTGYSYSIFKAGSSSWIKANSGISLYDTLFGAATFTNLTFNLPSDPSNVSWDFHFYDHHDNTDVEFLLTSYSGRSLLVYYS